MPASQIVKLNAFQIRQSVRTANFPSLISWHISAVIGVHSCPFQLSWFRFLVLQIFFLAFWLVWHYQLPLLISITFIFLFRVSVGVKKFQLSGKNLPSLLKLSLSPPRVALRIKQMGKPPAPTYYKTRSFLEEQKLTSMSLSRTLVIQIASYPKAARKRYDKNKQHYLMKKEEIRTSTLYLLCPTYSTSSAHLPANL